MVRIQSAGRTVRSETGLVRKWVNVPLLAVVALLVAYGSVLVQSATSGMPAGDDLFRRHLIGIVLGIVPMVIAWLIDYQAFKGWLGPLVVLDALLILSPRIPGLGYEAGGATSWLAIGGVRLFQPSEPAKLVTIVIMAIVNLGLAIPSSPGFVGTFQLFCIQALLLFGVQKSDGLTCSIIYHLAQFLPTTAVGLFFLFNENLSLKTLVESAAGAGESEGDKVDSYNVTSV